MSNYGNWRTHYLRGAGNAYYVDYNQKKDNGDALTVSEAHGYGMLLAVYHDCRDDFDGLVRYFDLFVNPKGLMGWQQKRDRHNNIVPAKDGDTDGTGSATDGDIDIAHALFLAADKWPGAPDGRGPSEYFQRAVNLCGAIFEYTVNKDLWVFTLGDWVDRSDQKVKEASVFWNLTRTSDFILAAVHTFAAKDVARRDGWERLRQGLVTCLLQLHAENPIGLLPDFAEYKHGHWRAVHGQVLESKHDGDFHYNSCRTPWRLAAYLKVSGDQRLLPILQGMVRFFEGQKMIHAGYKLNGKHYVDYSDRAFTAPAWMALHMMGSSHARRVWESLGDDEDAYFGDSIAMLCQAQL
ncbi:Six-hairpin glycosidase-like protein [Fimicolochytrium jonesii]|uniref:Six-hairpin glycosidase-like protein n=1 Tax=Fimicolochytrium jonesii TaxID=1396493 RepID=UPI0022FEEB58|nr:Six-hairpin glycosidase-like protein [Fimicolochytrium jonesii]KAI8817932.1 Six-hairpin glycosidase-like protein [Fimicolochytrium jonesii]